MFGNARGRQPSPGPSEWTLEIHDRDDGSSPYNIFLKSLDTYTRAVLDISVEEVLAHQGHNVCDSSWGKSLRGGLYEFRVNRSITAICKEVGVPIPDGLRGNATVLLRVFFAVEGAKIVLLLCGYDKSKDPSGKRQDREMAGARKLLKEHKDRKSRSSKGR